MTLVPPATPRPNACLTSPEDRLPGFCILGDITIPGPESTPTINAYLDGVTITGFRVRASRATVCSATRPIISWSSATSSTTTATTERSASPRTTPSTSATRCTTTANSASRSRTLLPPRRRSASTGSLATTAPACWCVTAIKRRSPRTRSATTAQGSSPSAPTHRRPGWPCRLNVVTDEQPLLPRERRRLPRVLRHRDRARRRTRRSAVRERRHRPPGDGPERPAERQRGRARSGVIAQRQTS